MGGAAGGATASRIATSTLIDRLTTGGLPPAKRLEKAICAANRAILTRAQQEPALDGMGTTLASLVLHEDHALIAHVGDSRVYRLHEGNLHRCTSDHSLVGEQVRLGQLTAAEAARSPMRHVITRALGIHRAVQAEVTELPLEPGDLFLLCSDGLTNELNDDHLAHHLREAVDRHLPLRQLCTRLIDDALEAGGRDNITCIAVHAS